MLVPGRSSRTTSAVAIVFALVLGPGVGGAEGNLPPLLERAVRLEAADLPLSEVFGNLREQSSASFLFGESVPLNRRVSFAGDGTLLDVLNLLSEREGLAFRVYNDATLLVLMDSPQKRWAFSAENPVNAPSERLPESSGARPVSFQHESASVLELFAVLEDAADIRFRYDVTMDLGERASLISDGVTVQDALDLLMLRQGLTYQVRYESFVLVYPGSFEKMKQHRDPRVAGLSAPGPPPGWSGGEFNPPQE